MAAIEWQRIKDSVKADKFETRKRALESLQARQTAAHSVSRTVQVITIYSSKSCSQNVINLSTLSRDQVGELVDMATDLLNDNNGKVYTHCALFGAYNDTVALLISLQQHGACNTCCAPDGCAFPNQSTTIFCAGHRDDLRHTAAGSAATGGSGPNVPAAADALRGKQWNAV
jgi:hypothetical protein